MPFSRSQSLARSMSPSVSLQRLLAVHHPRAGDLPERGDVLGRDVGHGHAPAVAAAAGVGRRRSSVRAASLRRRGLGGVPSASARRRRDAAAALALARSSISRCFAAAAALAARLALLELLLLLRACAADEPVRSTTAGAGVLGTRAGTRVATAADLATFVDRVGDHAAHEVRGTDRVVVAGDHVVDDVGVAVRVDDRDDRDVQAVRLGDRDVLLLRVDHEDHAGELLEVLDAAEVALELREVALDLQAFLLRHQVDFTGVDLALELAQLRDARVHRLEVGEHAAEPAEVHVRHAARGGLTLDRLLRLLLRADEQHAAALGDVLAHEPVRGVDAVEGLVQVDDVDPVALSEDESLHLRVPTPGLVPEMDASFQQLLHAYDGHGRASLKVRSSVRASAGCDCSRSHLGFTDGLGLIVRWVG